MNVVHSLAASFMAKVLGSSQEISLVKVLVKTTLREAGDHGAFPSSYLRMLQRLNAGPGQALSRAFSTRLGLYRDCIWKPLSLQPHVVRVDGSVQGSPLVHLSGGGDLDG